MTRIIGLIIFIPLGGATFVALLTLLVFLLPTHTGRAKRALETSPGRSFVIGLVNLIFFSAIAALLSQGGQLLGLISVFILLTLTGLAMSGLAGLVVLLRQRLHTAEYGQSPGATIRSAILLVMALLAPIAGWFVLAPIISLMGLGASISSLIKRTDPVGSSASY
jgi:hypothetical protein